MAEQNIFVSYSRSDADFVVKLATELKNSGATLWLDQLDIPFSAIWDVEIEKALEKCTCLLFILSESSVTSNNVLNEVYYALEESKRVLPVKISDCKIPFRIRRLHHIDLSVNYDKGFLQLLKTLNLGTRLEATHVKEPDDEEQIWGVAKSRNTSFSIEKYLDRFPEGKFKKEALRILDNIRRSEIEEENQKAEKILWTDAISKNTIKSYQDYLSQTELAAHVDEANSAIAKLKRKIEEESEDQLWQKAIKKDTIYEYDNYLTHHPSGRYAADAYNSRGVAKYNLYATTDAILDFTTAIKLEPNFALAFCNRATCKQWKGDYTDSIRDATKAIELKADYGEAYFIRGAAKYGLRDYVGAIQDYTIAIQLKPNTGLYYFNRGNSKKYKGDKAGACEDYKKACDLGYKEGCNQYNSTCK